VLIWALVALAVCLVLSALALWLLSSRFELVVQVPIDSDIAIAGPVHVAVTVPIDLLLTEREIDLTQLEVPLDNDIFIDDMIQLSTTMPVATQVATPLGITVPVNAEVTINGSVPIRQSIRVRDRLKLKLDKLSIPIKASVPVQLTVPLEQTFRVRTIVAVPLRLRMLLPTIRRRS
jgi:hypothetical protein